MEIIIGSALITCIVSLTLVYFFGYWGVLVASILSGLVGSYLLTALSGFGSPTGHVPKFNLIGFLITAALIFIGGLFIYYGCYYVKALITKEPIPKVLSIIWAGSLFLIISFYFSNKLIKHVKEREIYVELGFDRVLDLRSNKVSVSVENSGRKERCIFNSRGGSKEKNIFGYSREISSFKKLYFNPQKIHVKILDKKSISIPLPDDVETINIYVDKNFYLKLFVNRELFSEHQLK